MKITLNWLKDYVDFSWSPEELRERLTMLGIEVERMEKLGGEFEGVVVAQVLTSEKHPNADKLTVCRVADGKGERQIVCGAKNFKAGDKVPLILPGATLPAKPGEPPMTIKAGKIRGVESQGMMCSPQELGLAEDAEGLLILPADAQVGLPFAQHLGRAAGDVVYDLEITPNRPDLNSVLGIAREVSALTGNPLKVPAINLPADGAEAADKLVRVSIENADSCGRYTARVIKDVRIGPSPAWLKERLERVGVRSISNVVDVTNFVMLEIGQPLHAFDYHLLAEHQIIVRNAQDGEVFVAIDGQKRALDSQMLVVADPQHAIALAGVMGGQNTEINEKTVDVLIESAYFKPQNIRRTSKKLDLRTESSYRFERGCDPNMVDWASQRAAELILQTAGGKLARGVVDIYPKPVQPTRITLRHQKARQLLGVDLTMQNVNYLRALQLQVMEENAETCTVAVPTFRVDLKTEIDLVEEIARLHGVEKIPATPPRGAIGAHAYDSVHDQLAEARRLLTALGLSEAQGQTLIPDAGARLVTDSFVALENPLSSDMNVLRPSLLPGLLDSLRHNLTHKNLDVALFEIGRVFNVAVSRESTAVPVKEERRLAMALTGQRHPNFWAGENRDARFDGYDLKGVLEEFLEQFGVRGVVYSRNAEPTALFIESASVQLGKLQLGQFGHVSPPLARRYDLRDAVWLAELNLDMLLARRNPAKGFKPLPVFPSIRRDVAMIVPENLTHDAVLQVVKQTKPQNLESVELFDVFRGKNVPAGQKSMAYAFTYRHGDRTLIDAEVNTAHQQLVEQLKQKLRAAIRE